MSSAPSLILSVQGQRAERFDGQREQIFDCRDGSIGRADECDWVLGAEGVSRLHALIRYLNGLYFIEDRSTNGMLLNGASLRKGDPAALKHGDRLQIDTFEIGVRLSGETVTLLDASPDSGRSVAAPPAPVSASAPAPAAAPNIDALNLSLLLAPRRTGADTGAGAAGHADGLIPGAADAAAPGASLDPLALFAAPSSYFDEEAPAAPPVQGWNHTPAVSDRFRPPQVEPLRASGPLLPDDWDVTGSRVAPRREPQRDDSLLAPVMPVMPVTPVTPVTPVAQPGASASEPSAVAQLHLPAVEVPAFPVAPVPDSQPLPRPTSMPVPVSTPMEPPSVAISTTAAEPVASVQPAPSTGAASPELTEMFHIAVDAMMDVLRARAELKNSFRLPATLIQRSENNPLKFAPTAQEAVRKLFAPPNDGFLSGSAALRDAADDIRNHQMAMLAGVRSAFQSLLANFDPARIEKESEGSARRLPLAGRPRYWERYKAQFDALIRNPDECFQRLFGDEFARAYDEQLARLKRRRN
jgi:type VI secretion system FHA domain protein